MNPALGTTRWALLVAMVYPSLMAWLYFVLLSGRAPAQEQHATQPPRNPIVISAYAGAKAIQFAFPLVWVIAVQRRRPRFTGFASSGITVGMISGLAVAAAILAVYYAVVRDSRVLPVAPAVERLRLKIAEFGLSTPTAYICFGVFLAGVHSLLEEYYWRWFAFGELAKLKPLRGAVVLSSLAFAAHHVIDLAVFLPGAFWLIVVPMSAAVAVGGAFWAWLYARTGSLYAPWISHLAVDAALMVVGYDLVFRHAGMP